MDPEHVETQPTSVPSFDAVEPHPSSPAGQVAMWGTLARRIGPSMIRAAIVASFVAVLVLAGLELTR